MAETGYGTRLYQRALDLGLNYFDGRYGASSLMLRPLMQDPATRARSVLVTKTAETTRDGALRRIDEDRAELGTDAIDIFFLRTYNQAMLQAHLAPGGSLEGLLQARDEGKIRFLGLAGHSDMGCLADGIETGLIDAVIFPLNVVRRDAYERLIPAAQSHDVGLVVMKPLNAGTVPPAVGLSWLATQPIHTMVPGVSTIAHLEECVAALQDADRALSGDLAVEVEGIREALDRYTCRICDHLCRSACEQGLPLDVLLYHDVYYNQYRALGLEGLLDFALAEWVKGSMEKRFAARLEMMRRCTHCTACEAACPHDLPIRQMLDDMVEGHVALLEAVRERGWSERFGNAPSPYTNTRTQRGR
jgi:hypothetical protein